MVDGIDAPRYRAIGNVDSVEEFGAQGGRGSSIGRGAYAVVRGWVLHEQFRSPVDLLLVSLGTETAAVAFLGLSRSDVAEHYGSAALRAGFVAVIPVTVSPGVHRLSFAARVGDQILAWDPKHRRHHRRPEKIRWCKGRHERTDHWAFSVDGLFRSDGTRLEAAGEGDAVPWNCSAFIKLWAIDLAARAPAERIVARSGGVDLPVLDGLTRADAAASVSVLPAQRCGFAVPVSPPLYGTGIS